MGAIDNANLIKQGYINACNAVLGRGGSIASGTPIGDLAEAIINIPHDTTLAYHTAESETYLTKVPSNVEPSAKVNKIGGTTRKCNNLIPFYHDSRKTAGGVTYTPQDDGGIALNGVATEYSSFVISEMYKVSLLPTKFTISVQGSHTNIAYDVSFRDRNNSLLYTVANTVLPETNTVIDLRNYPDAYCLSFAIKRHRNNVECSGIAYPMINEGENELPYEPYFEGLRNASVTALESHGVNYLDLSGALNEQLVDNGDGTYTMTHNGGNNRFSGEAKVDVPFNVPLIIYGELIEGVRATVRVGNDNGWLNTLSFDTYAWLRTSTPEHPITKIQIYMQVGEDGLYAKIKHPRIVLGQTLLPYKPYVGKLDKIEIPEAVRNLEGYGQGVEGYPNTIEWRDGKCYFVCRTKRIVFDGTENWVKSDTITANTFRNYCVLPYESNYINTTTITPSICTHYGVNTTSGTYSREQGASVGLSWMYVYDNNYADTDVSLWKAHLAELYASGNPLTIEYALAEPIETDITDLMRDNFITVEGDGTLTAINEYEYDVPTSATYLIETTGG